MSTLLINIHTKTHNIKEQNKRNHHRHHVLAKICPQYFHAQDLYETEMNSAPSASVELIGKRYISPVSFTPTCIASESDVCMRLCCVKTEQRQTDRLRFCALRHVPVRRTFQAQRDILRQLRLRCSGDTDGDSVHPPDV